ncbi:MAG: hypothetical protein KAR40_01485 [Candidatus Sabulitectum sp.]|nr:hypothetical protein [Candidatus Sabulitectum sp.]
MKTVIFLCILPTILIALNFSDNFESYSPGDDLNSSAYWLRPFPAGNLIVADDGGNNIVETEWNSDSSAVYICMGSAIWSDGAVSADIKFTGSEAVAGLLSRVNSSTGECYMAGIFSTYPPAGATVIAHVDENGKYDILANDFFYPLNENTWYTVSFEVTGTNPVELKLSVNGSVSSNVMDSIFNLDTGLAGVVCGYDDAEPMFYIDNFSVDDYNTALTRVTFGGIKALFQ